MFAPFERGFKCLHYNVGRSTPLLHNNRVISLIYPPTILPSHLNRTRNLTEDSTFNSPLTHLSLHSPPSYIVHSTLPLS